MVFGPRQYRTGFWLAYVTMHIKKILKYSSVWTGHWSTHNKLTSPAFYSSFVSFAVYTWTGSAESRGINDSLIVLVEAWIRQGSNTIHYCHAKIRCCIQLPFRFLEESAVEQTLLPCLHRKDVCVSKMVATGFFYFFLNKK